MNGTQHEPASVTLAQLVATAPPVLHVAAPVVPGLLLSDGTKTGTNVENLDLSTMAIPGRALYRSRSARREERNGFPYTAAVKWRNAAELCTPNTRAVEYCWREWERIMGLPRRLAGPIGFFTSAELP